MSSLCVRWYLTCTHVSSLLTLHLTSLIYHLLYSLDHVHEQSEHKEGTIGEWPSGGWAQHWIADRTEGNGPKPQVLGLWLGYFETWNHQVLAPSPDTKSWDCGLGYRNTRSDGSEQGNTKSWHQVLRLVEMGSWLVKTSTKQCPNSTLLLRSRANSTTHRSATHFSQSKQQRLNLNRS